MYVMCFSNVLLLDTYIERAVYLSICALQNYEILEQSKTFRFASLQNTMHFFCKVTIANMKTSSTPKPSRAKVRGHNVLAEVSHQSRLKHKTSSKLFLPPRPHSPPPPAPPPPPPAAALPLPASP